MRSRSLRGLQPAAARAKVKLAGCGTYSGRSVAERAHHKKNVWDQYQYCFTQHKWDPENTLFHTPNRIFQFSQYFRGVQLHQKVTTRWWLINSVSSNFAAQFSSFAPKRRREGDDVMIQIEDARRFLIIVFFFFGIFYYSQWENEVPETKWMGVQYL